MFCCIAEIAMSVFGIVTLVRGKFSLTRSKTIVGSYAYAIGIILTLTLPILLGIGIVIGIVMTLNAHGRPVGPEEIAKYAYLDMIFVPMILVVVAIIASIAPKSNNRPSSPFDQHAGQLPPDIPPMGDNPYASPHTIDPNTPRPPKSR